MDAEGTESRVKLSELLLEPQFLDRLGASLPGLVYVYDLVERRNVFANRSLAELLGYPAHDVEAMGEKLLPTIIEGEDMPRVAAHLERLADLGDGQVVEIEYRVRSADGTSRWLHSWESVLSRDAEGRPKLLFGIAQDVTSKVRVEQDLVQSQRRHVESEQRWRSIVENPFDFVVVIDRDHKYTFINFAAPGLRAEDLIGKATPFDFVSPADHGVMRAAFDTAFNDGRPGSYEVHVPSLGKWYSSLVGPIREGGVVTHASVLTREITAEKEAAAKARRAEQQLQEMELKLSQSAKLEAVGQLAGGIAHDFNNVLMGIGALADLVAAQLSPGHPALRDVEEMHQAVARGAGLTRQLLAFSRQQPIEPTNIDLIRLLDDHARMLLRLLGERVQLDIVTPEAPLFVHGDRTQLEQVLLNLAINARDAMPEGGRLRIELRLVHVDEVACREDPEARVGAHAQILVQDSGVGMDGAVLARIFEPFFTTKPIGAGTGLGLAVVYGIVRQNGGFIRVSSKLGEGTTFLVHLPASAPGATVATAAARVRHGGSETILLVEDDATALRMTRRLLEMLGYKVEVAERGDEALGMIEAGVKFSLLFTDVLLPGVDGPELYRRAERLRPGLPVVFTSGYTSDLLAQKGIAEAGAAFLQKPFSHDELAAKVRAAIDVKA